MRAFLSTRYWIPARAVDEDEIHELYTHYNFEDEGCYYCAYADRRPVSACFECKNYLGEDRLYTKRKTEQGVFFGVPLAEWRRASKLLGVDDIPVTDLRKRIPFPQDLQFTGRLYTAEDAKRDKTANQETILDEFWNKVIVTGKNAGIIRAAPRSGKTVMSIALALELGYTTIITGSELGWLEQFLDAFVSSTNVNKLNKAVVLVSNKQSSKSYNNHPGIMVVKSFDAIPKTITPCVLLFAYQAVVQTPSRIVNHLHGKYTTLIVDEVHLGAADVFSSFLANLDVTYRIGLSATTDRNDGKSFIIYRLMGKVAAVSDVSIMQPDFRVVETGLASTATTPQGRVTALAKMVNRNKLILKHVFEDLRENVDHCMFIPVDRIVHMNKLMSMINQQAAYENAQARGKGEPEPWPYPLAVSYYGKTSDHKHIRTLAISKQIRVVVAVAKKVKHGISVPAWTHVYTGLAPIRNGPMYYQLSQRVCTPPPKGQTKPQPVIKHFIDAMPASAKTFRFLWSQSRYNKLSAMAADGVLQVSPKTMEQIKRIINSDDYRGPPQVAMRKKAKRAANARGGFMLAKR